MVTTRSGKSSVAQEEKGKKHVKTVEQAKKKKKGKGEAKDQTTADKEKVAEKIQQKDTPKETTQEKKSNKVKSTPKKNPQKIENNPSNPTPDSAAPSSPALVQTPSSQPNSKSPSAPSKPSKPSIYTDSELQTYKKYKEELASSKLEDLKSMCKKNHMKISGTKSELITRISDAKVLGVIPKCPECGGGRPKLDIKTKTYTCSGYLEDTVFKNCHKKFAYEEIVREPWID